MTNWLEYATKLIAKRLIVEEYVDDEVAEWRARVCSGCEHRDADKNKCKLCGCFLDLKTRSMVNYNPKRGMSEITHCPDGRWNDKHIAEFYKNN